MHAGIRFNMFNNIVRLKKIYIIVSPILTGCVLIGPVRIRHSSPEFATQSSYSVDLTGWQAKMASIEIWIPGRNAHKPHFFLLSS